MYTNELLEEIWEIRRKMHEECGGDIEVFARMIREGAAPYIKPGNIVHNREEIEAFYERRRRAGEAVAEDPAPYLPELPAPDSGNKKP